MKRDAISLSGLPDGVRVYLQMNNVGQILKDKGLDSAGSVQAFHTNNVMRRIIKYMPCRSGATIKLTIAQTDINSRYITTEAPFAKYLYYGKAMEGSPPKKVTGRPLNYTKTKNPQAGPFWDRRLAVEEGAVLRAELQRYINSRR